jgi:hypothetical protein
MGINGTLDAEENLENSLISDSSDDIVLRFAI